MTGDAPRAGHVWTLMVNHLANALRSGPGVVNVVMLFVVGLTIAGICEQTLEMSRQAGPARSRPMASSRKLRSANRQAEQTLTWWIGRDALTTPPGAAPTDATSRPASADQEVDDPRITFLTSERRGLLSLVFLITLAFLPFVVSSGTFNQFSGDAGSRGLRFLLLRTGRMDVYFGRVLAAFASTAAASAVLVALVATFFAFKYPLGSPLDVALWAARWWLAMVAFSLPYVALTCWISAAVSTPSTALLLSQLAIGVPVIALGRIGPALGADSWFGHWADRFTPWGWKIDLMHPEIARVALAYGVMAVLTLAFVGLGARTFRRRDV